MVSVVLIIANLAVISALFWFFDFPYRQYRIDLLREQLATARDSLFAAARDGAISFDDPAYGMTRQIINGMIGLADQIGIWQTLLMRVTRRFWEDPQESGEFLRHFASARSALTSDGRKVVDDTLNYAHRCLLSHMAHTSLCLLPIALFWDVTGRTFGAMTIEKADEPLAKSFLNCLDCQAYLIVTDPAKAGF